MRAIATNRIKIGQFVWELQRQVVKLGMGKWKWMLPPWQFQLRLAFAKHYCQRLLHQWPGHLNLIENC